MRLLFLREETDLQVFFSLFQTPHRVLQHCLSPPSSWFRPTKPTPMVCGAALEGWGWSPTFTPALQLWLQQESWVGRDSWKSLTQPPAASKVSSNLDQVPQNPKGGHSTAPLRCCVKDTHGEMLTLGAFSLKPEGISHCKSLPVEHLSIFYREMEGEKEHLPLPFHHGHTPSLSI